MFQTVSHTSLHTLIAIASVLVLSGCGKSDPANKAPIIKHIITSAVDCSENASMPYEKCSEVIEKAVAAHESDAPKFKSLKACEASEGTDKCERIDEKSFRPKLVAFMLTMSEVPVAAPLYASNNGQLGFRGADSTAFVADDEKFVFSKSAVHAAELLGTAAKEEKLL